jgi:hypothetical protein
MSSKYGLVVVVPIYSYFAAGFNSGLLTDSGMFYFSYISTRLYLKHFVCRALTFATKGVNETKLAMSPK